MGAALHTDVVGAAPPGGGDATCAWMGCIEVSRSTSAPATVANRRREILLLRHVHLLGTGLTTLRFRREGPCAWAEECEIACPALRRLQTRVRRLPDAHAYSKHRVCIRPLGSDRVAVHACQGGRVEGTVPQGNADPISPLAEADLDGLWLRLNRMRITASRPTDSVGTTIEPPGSPGKLSEQTSPSLSTRHSPSTSMRTLSDPKISQPDGVPPGPAPRVCANAAESGYAAHPRMTSTSVNPQRSFIGRVRSRLTSRASAASRGAPQPEGFTGFRPRLVR